jgi:preprotein translocase subunit SecA
VTGRSIALGVVRGAYPEREEERLSKLDDFGERLAGAVAGRIRSQRRPWRRFPALVANHAEGLEELSDEALRGAADELRPRLRQQGFEDGVVARAFALVREAATRTLGQRHFDVQLAGGWVLLHGIVAEMETGEGKTLAATLPASTAALAGMPVHVVTVNDYLASRDAETMGPLYRMLGLTVGTVVTEMDPAARRAAYACDVTYCTNKQLVFDYLWDRISLGGRPGRTRLKIERLGGHTRRTDELLHRGLHFAIVDEADSVLVDEARTPLIISERSDDTLEQELYRTAVELAGELERDRDFAIDDRENHLDLLEPGRSRLAELAEPLGGIWVGRLRREALVGQALVALHCYHRDHQYLVQEEKIAIIDEYTGRLMPDRSWEHGLHQMMEVKEGLPVTGRQDPRARISYQRFFRRYLRLAGMTGTAREVAGELSSVYRLPVVTIPTNRPVQRCFVGERVLPTAEEKWRAVVERIEEVYDAGRPVLVGTRSVAASDHLSQLLEEAVLPHRVLNARQDREEADIIAKAGEPGQITIATNMAGRGTDIQLAPEVVERGGLHVIATELHEARRIDRQLFGRCGRQGDPGSFESIASLEDELFETHADPLSRWIAGAGARDESRIGRSALEFSLRRCQRAAERLHSRARKSLLERDTRLDSLLAFSGRPE